MSFEHLSVTENLSQSSVGSIAQDRHGFMWFSTLDGLNKFDGYHIQTYYSSDDSGLMDNVINCVYSTPDRNQIWVGTADHGICKYDQIYDKFISYSNKINPSTLVNDHVTCITGKDDELWIGTEKGLSLFNQQDDLWVQYNSENSDLSNDYITCLLLDNKQNLWIGTSAGIFILDLQSKKINNLKNISEQHISSIVLDANGNIWIGTHNGIVFYNSKIGKIQNNSVLEGMTNKHINALLFDFENILWIGTNNGLVRYDTETQELIIIKNNATDKNSLSVNNVISIYEDNTHILWFGTSLGGVNKWNRAAQELLVFRHNPYNSNSLTSNQIRSIYEDEQGIIWIGTVDEGLNKWDKDLFKFMHIKHKQNDKNTLPGNHVRTILQGSKKRFWVGTAKNGLCILDPQSLKVQKVFKHNPNDNTSLSNNNIWKIIEDKQNDLWLATYGGGLCRVIENNGDYKFKAYQSSKNENSLSNNFCTTVFCDSKNRLWVGTNDGLSMLDSSRKSFERFRYKQDDTFSISNNRIYSIIEGRGGIIWIGTKGGLNKYNEDGTFSRFTVKSHNLSNDVIMGLLEDNNQNLWLATNRGLCKFNPYTLFSRTYDVKDGVQSNEFLVGSFLETKDGMFIFGGINGFNAFYPEKIKINNNLPSIVITNFMVSNENYILDSSISEKKQILLSNNQNDLTFRFVAIDYILPEKNQYKYMLEGYDKDWIYCKHDKIAKYTNLQPGHYKFKVIGSNNDLIWNKEGATVNLYIKPAFYQTIYFKIFSILLLIIIVITIFKVRVRIERQQKIKLQQEVDRQTLEIRTQRDEILNKNGILEQQKEEIEAQRDEILDKSEILKLQKEEIEAQRDELDIQHTVAVHQRDEIALHKKEIDDSIIYAERIQKAAMPENKLLQLLFEEFFIFFKPRDIVSGDFYWATQKNGKLIAVAADCTGHGVPGAFMSMLGISFLNKIVNEKQITEPDKILNRLRSNVISALKQSKNSGSKDGMDITVSVIDKKNKTLETAAANNAFYLIRNDELIEYKADKMPIAIFDNMKPFSKKNIKYLDGDIIYMFSDGYADQFGGPKSKKFRYGTLKKLLLKIHKEDMKKQKIIVENKMTEWMSFPDKYTNEDYQQQIDDILVFAIKL